jgi:hypothetical protein
VPASQAVAGTAVTVEAPAMHRKKHRNNRTDGAIRKGYLPVKNIYQQVKNVKKVVDFSVSLR